MADQPISTLPAATTLSASDVSPVLQSGTTKQATLSQFIDLIGQGVVTTGTKFGRLRKQIAGTIGSAGDTSWAPQPVFDVTDYGVVYNSSGAAAANDTAIGAALTALNSAGGGVLFFPGFGTCYIAALHSVSAAYSWKVLGDGSGATIIQQLTSNTGVFSVTQTDSDAQFAIQGITLSYDGSNDTNTAEALLVENTVDEVNRPTMGFMAEDIAIYCIDPSAQKAFAVGISLRNLHNSYINNYTWAGRPTGQYGIGLKLDKSGAGGSGLKCIAITLSNSRLFSGDTCINLAYDMEGLHISNCIIFGANYGVTFTGTTTMIQMELTNCHLNNLIANVAQYSLVGTTVTAANPAVFTSNAHGLLNGYLVQLKTTGALPSPLAVDTDYYVINKTANTFQLSTSYGGSAINTIGGTQSGTHYFVNFYYSTNQVVWQSSISNCLFYQGFMGANCRGILGNFGDSTFTGNVFNFNATGCIGIDFQGLSYGNVVVGNRFMSPSFAATPVRCGHSATWSKITNNQTTGGDATMSWVDDSNYANNFMGEVGGFQGTVTPSTSVASVAFDIDLTRFHLGKAPGSVQVTPAIVAGNLLVCKNILITYDATSGSTTKTNARCLAYTVDGANFSASAPFGINISVFPVLSS